MPVAASDKTSVATFYSSNMDPGTSSLFKPDGTAEFNVGKVFNVPIIKIADWLAKFPFGQNGVEYIEHVKVSAGHCNKQSVPLLTWCLCRLTRKAMIIS